MCVGYAASSSLISLHFICRGESLADLTNQLGAETPPHPYLFLPTAEIIGGH